MIDLTKWANGSHNSFGDAMYMAALTTALVFAVGVVVWRLGKRLILHTTNPVSSRRTPNRCRRTPDSSYALPTR